MVSDITKEEVQKDDYHYMVHQGKLFFTNDVLSAAGETKYLVRTGSLPCHYRGTLSVGGKVTYSLIEGATADAAATKSPARIALGNQVFPIAAAIGAQATRIDVNLDAPVVVNSGEFVHIILKMPLGSATASQIIRGVVGFNGYFE